MMRSFTQLAAAAAVLVVTLAPKPAAAAAFGPDTARFALVLGNNEGGAGRPRLWFAERDADRFARDLVELGSFAPDDVTVLHGATAERARAALAGLEGRIGRERGAGRATLLVLYFSGHASAEGLELGSDRFGFDALRDLLTRSAADARIAIVDACESGVLTQVKGARAAPRVDFPLPLDPGAKGIAFIASTAVGESAQESATLEGSFFSVNLDAALRGAADADGDGQVTLAEAFRYASSMTIAGTADTTSGPQHPTFDIRMAGRGDVVLTSLQRAEARLVLPGNATDRFIVASERGLVAEAPGGTTVGLAAGHYAVEWRHGTDRERAEVDLGRGETRPLPPMMRGPAVASRAKGGAAAGLELTAGATLGSALTRGQSAAPGFLLGLELPRGMRWLAQVDYRSSQGDDRGFGYRLATAGLRVGGLAPLLEGRVNVGAGLEAGFEWNSQQIAGGVRTHAPDALLGPVGRVSLPLAGLLTAGIQLAAPLHLVRIDERTALRPRIEAGIVVGFAP